MSEAVNEGFLYIAADDSAIAGENAGYNTDIDMWGIGDGFVTIPGVKFYKIFDKYMLGFNAIIYIRTRYESSS